MQKHKSDTKKEGKEKKNVTNHFYEFLVNSLHRSHFLHSIDFMSHLLALCKLNKYRV